MGTSIGSLLGSSQAMDRVRAFARRAAKVNVPVLILGETGTGKSLLGRVIHGHSVRKPGPFLAINCAGIPDSLFESEFFGHQKGAFTGAGEGRKGIIEQAQGGSLFLDEVGELSPSQQAKLLTALEEGEVRRLGGAGTVRVDVRVMAATSRNIPQEMREGGFRRDLYHRLAVLVCLIPPLRERREDIPFLARSILRKLQKRHHRQVAALSSEVLDYLGGHPWPGNIRELTHLLEAALILSDEGVLGVDALQGVEAMKSEGELVRAAQSAPSEPGRPDPTRGMLSRVPPWRSGRPSSRLWPRPGETRAGLLGSWGWPGIPSGKSFSDIGWNEGWFLPYPGGRLLMPGIWKELDLGSLEEVPDHQDAFFSHIGILREHQVGRRALSPWREQDQVSLVFTADPTNHQSVRGSEHPIIPGEMVGNLHGQESQIGDPSQPVLHAGSILFPSGGPFYSREGTGDPSTLLPHRTNQCMGCPRFPGRGGSRRRPGRAAEGDGVASSPASPRGGKGGEGGAFQAAPPPPRPCRAREGWKDRSEDEGPTPGQNDKSFGQTHQAPSALDSGSSQEITAGGKAIQEHSPVVQDP